MMGIDTNLLLRLFETADDPRQTAAARRAIEAHAPVFVSAIVLASHLATSASNSAARFSMRS
jgi:predicted nucleic-acid-binding protein